MKGNPRVDAAVLILRVGLGLILMYYGSQKLLGVFGGLGPKATIDMFHDNMNIPAPFTILAMCGEFFGGLGMIVGLFTSLAAFGAACTMAVATYQSWKTPGLLNGLMTGTPDSGPKAFYSMAIFLGATAVMIIGGGNLSLDARLFLKKGGRR